MSSASQSDDIVECKHESCQQTFAHLQAMRSHHTQKHGKSEPERTCELDGCEDVVTSRGPDARFCSRQCAGLAQKNRVSVTCDSCGASCEIKKSRVERGQENFYCSVQCKALGQRDGEYVECDHCDETFYRNRARLESSQSNHYCTLQCRALGQRDGEYVECACCYKSVYRTRDQLNQGTDTYYCSNRCKGIDKRKTYGYDNKLRRYTRPGEFRELIRHVYFYEGHTFEATCRIVNAELEGEFSEAKIEEVVADLKTYERNVRNRVWALRPEDLGLSPIGEVA